LERRKAELQEAGLCDVPGNEPARFLHELRRLRTEAGLGHAELAARAHYPYDVIRAAEAGPSLPSLPVLSAYVRGCGGTVTEWEERWRSLNRSPALPLLPARSAGESEAATAGARVGAATLAADGHDPALIMAALDRVADGMAADSSSPSAAAVRAASGAASLSGAASPSGVTSLASATSLPEAAPSAVRAGPSAATALSPDPAGHSPDPAGHSPDPAGHSLDIATPLPAVADGPAPAASRPRDVSPVRATGRGAGSRSLTPPRIAIAALVAVLVIVLLALFA
jgi:hypothetical protein